MPPKPKNLALPPGAVRADAALMEARLNEVVRRIGKLHTARRMMRDLAVEWNLSPQSVYDTYILPAKKRMRKEYEDDVPYAADRIRETLSDLYEQAEMVGDHKTMAMVLKQLASLEGVNAPTHVNANLAGGSNVQVTIGPMNPDATRERTEELLSRPDIAARVAELLAKKTP
jgi:hypothetical protein